MSRSSINPTFFLRPRTLQVLYIGLLAAYSFYKTTRNDASDFLLYVIYWIIFPSTVLFIMAPMPLIKSPCLQHWPPPFGCSSEQLGGTIEGILYLPASAVFFVSWLAIARASVAIPGRGSVRVFLTEVDTRRRLNFVSCMRPAGITAILALPVLASLFAVHYVTDKLLTPLSHVSPDVFELKRASDLWIAQMLNVS